MWSNDRLTDSTRYSPLPWELIEHIVSFLDNSSIKNLRLTCRLFAPIKLRINRVFISLHSTDIITFYAIASCDIFRHDIVEIVYDDALVCFSPDYNDMIHNLDESQTRYMSMEQAWYQCEVNANIED